MAVAAAAPGLGTQPLGVPEGDMACLRVEMELWPSGPVDDLLPGRWNMFSNV